MIKMVLISLLVATGFIFSPIGVFAQSDDISAQKGAESLGVGGSLIPECLRVTKDKDGNEVVPSRDAGADCIEESIVFYINILLVIVAIGAFLYMLYGAFLYATAFGDDSKIGQAKKTVTHAIIGIILAGMSALLVELLRKALGA